MEEIVMDAEWTALEKKRDLTFRKQRAYDYLSRSTDRANRRIAKIFAFSLGLFLGACVLALLVG